MTLKDIRDIAAYYGAKCSFNDTPKHNPKENKLDGFYLDELSLTDDPRLINFKLHLRPIISLTDGEVRQCMKIADIGFSTRLLAVVKEDIKDGHLHNLIDIIQVGAYLQSIWVYIPGTINPDFVELIKPSLRS